MKRILKLNEAELKSYCHKVLKKFNRKVVNKKGFLYSRGSIPVLLVAHMDTVHMNKVKEICQGDGILWSPQGIGGDDRTGIYMILEIIKELDCHVLFTESEEIGGIGATLFTESGIVPDINFVIEFDRKGNNDAVFYDCHNQDFIKAIEEHGFRESTGSFSDISIICPCLKVSGVNLSSGYYNAHSLLEHINIRDVASLIKRSKTLIKDLQAQKFEYIEFEYDDELFPFDESWESYFLKYGEVI